GDGRADAGRRLALLQLPLLISLSLDRIARYLGRRRIAPAAGPALAETFRAAVPDCCRLLSRCRPPVAGGRQAEPPAAAAARPAGRARSGWRCRRRGGGLLADRPAACRQCLWRDGLHEQPAERAARLRRADHG